MENKIILVIENGAADMVLAAGTAQKIKVEVVDLDVNPRDSERIENLTKRDSAWKQVKATGSIRARKIA